MELLDSLIYMLNEMSPYILLGFFIAGLMHAFVSRPLMSRHLAGSGWRAVIKAALIGVPLPLCSCGVLPTAISMRRGGASKASTVSFLISTPQTGVDSIAATWSLLGPAFALLRPVAALVTSVAGGLAVGRDDSRESTVPCDNDECMSSVPFGRKCADALRYGFVDLVGSIGGWLVAGLLVAALITAYVPADFFAVIGSSPLLSMLAVLIVAVPMYVCATGSIPIALALVLKGLSPGTALVFLMAGPAVNFASFTLISRELGRRVAVLYLIAIVTGAVLFGLLIDYVLPSRWFAVSDAAVSCRHCTELPLFQTLCSAVLLALLLYTQIKNRLHNSKTFQSMTKEYKVKGMNCPHCQASVAKAIAGVNGVTGVDVNLSSGIAVVEGEHKADEVCAAVKAAGFDIA